MCRLRFPHHASGDALVGLKWRVFEREVYSLLLKRELLLPSGDENSGLGNGRTDFALTTGASMEYGALTVHANPGWTHNRCRLSADQEAISATRGVLSTGGWYGVNPQWRLVADAGVLRGIERAR